MSECPTQSGAAREAAVCGGVLVLLVTASDALRDCEEEAPLFGATPEDVRVVRGWIREWWEAADRRCYRVIREAGR